MYVDSALKYMILMQYIIIYSEACMQGQLISLTACELRQLYTVYPTLHTGCVHTVQFQFLHFDVYFTDCHKEK